MLGSLAKHSSHYALGSGLVTLASLISFPLLTRILSVDEYGTLSLIGAVLLLFTGLGKLGMQHSIVRFQAEVSAGKRPVDEAGYVTTVLVGLGITGLLGSAAMAITSLVVPEGWWNNAQVATLLLPVSAFILVRALDSGVINLLRAQQRSVAYNVYVVLKKYFALIAALGVMFLFVPHLRGFYLGTFVAEALVTIVAIAYLSRLRHTSIAGFSIPTFQAMLAFGIPMIAYELSGIILNLGDRYVIQAVMGSEAVGQYSAAYNLCEYLQLMLMSSLAQAVSPIYLKMWEEKGDEETRQFIERTLRFYVLGGVAVLAGASAVGADVLVLLASEKYRAGGVVIPYVVAGMLISGAIPIFAAGLYIHKQNYLMIPFVFASAVLNIALNLWLLPKIGLLGAGIATLVGYSFLALCCWWIGVKRFRVKLPIWETVKFGLLALAMYVIVMQISTENAILTMLLKVLAGVAIYVAAIAAFDRQVRTILLQRIVPRVARWLGFARTTSGDPKHQAQSVPMLMGLAKKSIKTCVASPWGWRLSAPFRSATVTALTYHRITAAGTVFPGIPVERFREQMQWVAANCTPIRPDEIFDAARRVDRMRPPVVVTFDDGYRDYHDVAYPVLRQYKVPATMFLPTDFIDNGGLIWTDKVYRAVMTTTRQSVNLSFMAGSDFMLTDEDARYAFIGAVKLQLKGLPDADRQRQMAELLFALDVADTEDQLDRQMLSWDEVRATLDGTSYGGHSHTHPILSQLSLEALDQEIRLCRDRLQAEIGTAPTCFAYPNGRQQDFDVRTKEALQRYGFKVAFSTIEGMIHADSDPMELRRQAANDSTLGDFAALVAGANSTLRGAKHRKF